MFTPSKLWTPAKWPFYVFLCIFNYLILIDHFHKIESLLKIYWIYFMVIRLKAQ